MRRFTPASAAPQPQGPPVLRLRVCSYNLLAERWTRDGQHDYVSPRRLLDGAARTRRALDELAAYDPDVCALQEVQRDVHDGPLREWMRARGYSGAFVAKSRRLRGPARVAAAAKATALASASGGAAAEGAGGGGGSGSSGDSDSGASDGGEATRADDPAENDDDEQEGGGGGGDDDEGVALLWRDALLERVDGAAFRFCDAAPASRLLSEFGDAAAVAVLRHRASGQALVAASVHLFWDPRLAHVKARQAALVARRCAVLARRHAGGTGGDGGGAPLALLLPVVIAGDWNSMPPPELCCCSVGEVSVADSALSQEEAVRRAEAAAASAAHPGSGVYRLLATGTLPSSHPDHPAAAAARAAEVAGQGSGEDEGTGPRPQAQGGRRGWRRRSLSTRGLAFASAHAAARGGREPALTTRTATFQGALDHVFFSRHGAAGGGGDRGPLSWRVAATLDMPELDGPIPDARWPSDHLAVGADLELVPPPYLAIGSAAVAVADADAAGGGSERGGGSAVAI
jgi:mRNA deadenylase 3'-5' endonuclease subunit Ccr4